MKELEVILFFAFVVWVICRNIRTQIEAKDNPDEFRRQLEADFQAVQVQSPDARFAFDGRTATVVKNDETFSTSNHAVVGMHVTRLARNNHGEYFLFIWDDSRKPFFKHLDQSRAKFLLGDKYVSPQRGIISPPPEPHRETPCN